MVLSEFIGMLVYSLLGAGLLGLVAFHVAGMMVDKDVESETRTVCEVNAGGAQMSGRTRVVENIKGFIALKRG